MAAAAFDSCAAAVLAGGRSSRFGSDKALAEFRGTTLLRHLLDSVLPLRFAEILVVAKATAPYEIALAAPPDSRERSIQFLRDESEILTPLAGLDAALRKANCDWIFACAADMPFAADRKLLEALFEKSSGEAAVAPLHAGEIQPLCALWNRARCASAAAEMLREKNPPQGPRALLRRVNARTFDWPDARPFADADTREALAALEAEGSG